MWSESARWRYADANLRRIRVERRRIRRRKRAAGAMFVSVTILIGAAVLIGLTGRFAMVGTSNSTTTRPLITEKPQVAGRSIACDIDELVEEPDAGLTAVGTGRCVGDFGVVDARRELEFGYEDVLVVFHLSGEGWERRGVIIPTTCESLATTEASFPEEICP